MKDIQRGLWIIAFGVTLFVGAQLMAEVNDQKDWVKGGAITGIKNDGGCVFKPFIKVGSAEDHPDDGEPQILGYSPGNVQVDKDGEIIYERLLEAQFVPLNRMKPLRGRICKCPPYNE